MKKNRNIKKIFQTAVFTFFAFFIFGAINVNAETVTVYDEDTFLNEFKNIDNTSDIVQLNNDIDMSAINYQNTLQIYKDKTIDLKGNTLILPNMQLAIQYNANATVKFIDSSSGKTGKILGADNSTGAYPLIKVFMGNSSYTDTYLVFDGVKIERNTDVGGKVVENGSNNTKINKVSFINTDITNFAFLNDGREADNFYYENITFKRDQAVQGFLIKENISVSNVISEDSKIIKESRSGNYKQDYPSDTKMTDVYVYDDVIKVVYKRGISVSNVNFDIINYKDSPVSKDITIKNTGEENIEITNVSVSSNDFIVTGPTSGVTLSSGNADTSWSIIPKDGLGGGTYVETITVTAGGKTYSSTVTLTVKEVDSEGNDVVYVSSKDELNSAIEAGNKYIKFADDITYYTGFVSIPVNNNVTIDLNGKTLFTRTGYFGLNYQDAATIKITDSSNAKTGKIIEDGIGTDTSGGIIQLVNNVADTTKECNFIIDGVNVTSTSYRASSMIFVSGSNIKSIELVNSLFSNYKYVLDGSKIDKITFENVKATSYEYQYIYLVDRRSELTFGNVITSDSEVVHLNSDGTFKEFISNDRSLTENLNVLNGQSIQVRYKSGFNVTAESKTISYMDSTDEYYVINITNRGLTNISIENVTIDNANFELLSGSSGIVDAGMTDNSWKIKVKDGVTLAKGVYTVNISVEASDNNTYKGTFTLTVNSRTLNNLEIGNISSEVTYGDTISPSVIGTDSSYLSLGDYEISYKVLENGSYVSITDKPKNVGKYKAVLKPRGENYTFDEVSFDFEIIPLSINPTVSISSVTYNGSEQRPDFTVLHGDTVLYADRDYSFTYSNNTNAGEAKVTISPKDGGNYTFASFDKKFTIRPKDLSESDVTLTPTSFRHTGSEIKPEPVVKDGDKELVLGTDYSLSYEGDITNIGTTNAKVVVTGKGNYKNVVKVNFDIIAKDSQEISFNESNVTKTYGDSNFTITANHTQGNGTIKYTSSNTDVAEVNETTGLVTIKKAGTTTIKATASETEGYAETNATYTLKVEKKELSYTATVENKVFDNNKNATVSSINFTGLVGSETLTKDTDYTVTAEFVSANVGSNIDVNVKVVLKDTDKANNYNLINANYVAKANITGKAIEESWVTVDTTTTYTYDGTQKKAKVTVEVAGTKLTEGTDYTVTYGKNINAGTGTLTVKGTGNYSGEVEKTFEISKKEVILEISEISPLTYNGQEQRPSITIKDRDNGNSLIPNEDYTLSYSNNTNAGDATITITKVNTSNYTFGSTTKTFKILKYTFSLSDVSLSAERFIYDGNELKPNVTVKVNNIEIPNTEYDVIYDSDITSVGSKNVTIKAKNTSLNYQGEVNVNYEIVNKTVLTISGISDQQVTYTGSPVELVGNLTVSNEISPSSLIEKWYKDGTEIDRPTNVGVYKVVYSYEDDTYMGSKAINVEITKKTSTIPSVSSYKGVVGDKLSTITLPDGFKWVDSNETITIGNKEYSATYTENNDIVNYTTETTVIEVYGKVKVNLNTSVNGLGGTISSSKTNILEGTTETITFTPNTGFEISKVEVNEVDKTSSIANNKLDVVIGNNDVNVVVTYKVIEYTITINDVANATINPSGIIKVDYNSNKELTIMADLGYKLISVKVNGVERISDIVNDKLTLENILADAEVVVVVEKNVYEVIEGSYQKYIITKNSEAKFRIDADYIKFENGGKVYVDDVLVDPSNYTSLSGSTIITLKKAFADQLSVGDHTLRVEFTDGEATTMFTIAKLASEENPKTGDNIGFYILTGIISTLGLAGAGTYIYRRKQTN